MNESVDLRSITKERLLLVGASADEWHASLHTVEQRCRCVDAVERAVITLVIRFGRNRTYRWTCRIMEWFDTRIKLPLAWCGVKGVRRIIADAKQDGNAKLIEP